MIFNLLPPPITKKQTTRKEQTQTNHIRCKLDNLILKVKKLWFYRFTSYKYGFEIPYEIYNNSGVFFAHSGRGTIINSQSQIGDGTYIQHSVTFGVRDDIKDNLAPKVGKNCYIGARAVLIGGIVIGDNCKIGAGAVVVNDIPANATAVGVPAKVIKINNTRV